MHRNTTNSSIAVSEIRFSEPSYDLLRPMRLWSESPDADSGITEAERALFALAVAVEQRDRNTAGHCERLAFISVAMGVFMGMDQATLLTLYRGGYLHDLGKVGIPDSILFKPGKLNDAEWEVMRTHPKCGADICRHLRTLRPVIPIIRHHHERWDGSGYPDGLCGSDVPLLAQIVQIADIYDALTGPRPYKMAYTPEKALNVIREETVRGWRNPELVETFFALHKAVISKAEDYTAGADGDLESMRAALLRLQLWPQR